MLTDFETTHVSPAGSTTKLEAGQPWATSSPTTHATIDLTLGRRDPGRLHSITVVNNGASFIRILSGDDHSVELVPMVVLRSLAEVSTSTCSDRTKRIGPSMIRCTAPITSLRIELSQPFSPHAVIGLNGLQVYTTKEASKVAAAEPPTSPAKVSSTHVSSSSSPLKSPTKTPSPVTKSPAKSPAASSSLPRAPTYPLEGCIIVLSGFVNPLRGQLRKKIEDLGGSYAGDWSEGKCTHLISSCYNTPKATSVTRGYVVKKDWLEDCHATDKRLSERAYAFRELEHLQSPVKASKVSTTPDRDAEHPPPPPAESPAPLPKPSPAPSPTPVPSPPKAASPAQAAKPSPKNSKLGTPAKNQARMDSFFKPAAKKPKL
eukprot:NODE_3152_length_1269_cov_112.554974_g2993_i0.p1 GENE.NODE_3152_length_1269_cov_112.554974_g2993_i0~~NODE_3152_length_1269_cov_112.554974_g2993_i0.p1  ORF type:complete len:374 (+),score=28.52 NODE_3152_length_1269_cov_112.554974_g2993_i0:59-1180(+)